MKIRNFVVVLLAALLTYGCFVVSPGGSLPAKALLAALISAMLYLFAWDRESLPEDATPNSAEQQPASDSEATLAAIFASASLLAGVNLGTAVGHYFAGAESREPWAVSIGVLAGMVLYAWQTAPSLRKAGVRVSCIAAMAGLMFFMLVRNTYDRDLRNARGEPEPQSQRLD